MACPEKVPELVDRFSRNREAYTSGKYNETQLRREFIDPFFIALGWDVNNEKGYAESYKDVIHEDAIKVGGATKAPDYCFRIGGTRKFFLEAKKPSVNLRDDIPAAFQLRRYAWSSKLLLSILTDFEEFAVYDCRVKPHKNDKASTARIQYLTYDKYPDKWDEIRSIFSPEAISKGSFDKYAQSKKKRGTAEVDDSFLKEIEKWREMLARNIAIRNEDISRRDLNYAVQRTIDRVIFLRICEDRGIEQQNRLQALLSGPRIYPRLVEIFYRADEKYNSGLFHFQKEKDRTTPPDDLTPGLDIDDKVLKDIIRNLYYPDSPYEFSVLPADILGQVYEQFLGKVIRLTKGHHAVVEDKPEVKKAGGVYYTPTYIVDYIVKNTVGKLLDGKTPNQASKLRILDPACGSGSFLIGAYQHCLDYHLRWYSENEPEKHARGRNPKLYQSGFQSRVLQGAGNSGDWKLTTSERKRILLNNIYGVDIDTQAVEVTKLSLLLKVLEGESGQTLENQLKLYHERALPDLSSNIKCGNSLIGSDFYEGKQTTMFDDEEKYRINAFDWKDEFPEIFKGKTPGFDAVIGNPPYIRIQAMKEWAPVEVELYKEQYSAAGRGNYDIYVVFVEKGLSLLNHQGYLGFILPHKFFNAKYGEPLRTVVSQGKYLSHVVHFGHEQVFADATTYTCLLFLEKRGCRELRFAKVENLAEWEKTGKASTGMIPAKTIGASEWNFVVGKEANLFTRLNTMPLKLGNIANIFVGLQTSADDVFIMDMIKDVPTALLLKSKALNTEWTFEKDLLFPLVSGTDVKRYYDLPERQYILFPYKVDDDVELIDLDEISRRHPKTAAYLKENKHRLEMREKGKARGTRWYGYLYLKNMKRQSIKKLCVPRLVDKLYATYDAKGNHFLDNVDVGGITLNPAYQEQGLLYLLGLLNSKLLCWYFPFVSAPFRGGWLSANRQFLSQLPMRTIDFSNPGDKSRHDRMVELVEVMLKLHKDLAKAKTEHDRTVMQRQIDATDRQIDKLVYELYGLTEEEIKIVEGAK